MSSQSNCKSTCLYLNGTKLVWLSHAQIPVSPPWLTWPKSGATESSFCQERLRTELALSLFHCNVLSSWTLQGISLPRSQGSVGFCHSYHPSQGGLSVLSLCPLAGFVDWLVERCNKDKGVQKHPLYPVCVLLWDRDMSLIWFEVPFASSLWLNESVYSLNEAATRFRFKRHCFLISKSNVPQQ